MPRTQAELKTELEAEAARLIDEVLAWNEQAQAPTLAVARFKTVDNLA